MILIKRSAHEQTLSVTDSDARVAWLSLAGSALTVGGMGSGAVAARLAATGEAGASSAAQTAAKAAGVFNTGANYADTAATVNQAVGLGMNWNNMTPTERAQAGLQLVFWGGMRGIAARNAGQGLDGLSLRQQIYGARAASLHFAAGRVESSVTPALQSIAKANGGELLGLQYRLKTTGSLKRKIATSPEKHNINDALRYTISFDEQHFTQGAQNTMASLKAQGYTQVKFSNTFKPGKSYMGINITYRTPEGYEFELQFHTPASFQMKDAVNHPLYEKQRVLPRKSQQFEELNRQMIQNSSSVPIPPGASSIKSVR